MARRRNVVNGHREDQSSGKAASPSPDPLEACSRAFADNVVAPIDSLEQRLKMARRQRFKCQDDEDERKLSTFQGVLESEIQPGLTIDGSYPDLDAAPLLFEPFDDGSDDRISSALIQLREENDPDTGVPGQGIPVQVDLEWVLVFNGFVHAHAVSPTAVEWKATPVPIPPASVRQQRRRPDVTAGRSGRECLSRSSIRRPSRPVQPRSSCQRELSPSRPSVVP